jgi:hypothetical protein
MAKEHSIAEAIRVLAKQLTPGKHVDVISVSFLRFLTVGFHQT